MTTEKICKNCMYYAAGECRIEPRVPVVAPDTQLVGPPGQTPPDKLFWLYPVMQPNDSCADFMGNVNPHP